jgi:WD40 repeat protein
LGFPNWIPVTVFAAIISCLFVHSEEQGRPEQPTPESARLTGHTHPARTLTYSSDSKKLASGGDDGAVIVWDTVPGTERVLPGEPGRPVQALAFSPDNATLAVAYACAAPNVFLWDVATGTERSRLGTRTFRATRLAFSPDGTTLAIGCGDSAIRLWDLASGTVRATLLGHRGSISSIRYASGGRTLASGCAEGLLKLWDDSDEKVRERICQCVHAGTVLSLAFSSDGTVLASGGVRDGIKLLEVESGRERSRLATDNQTISAVEFSADQRTLIVVRPAGVIQLWNLGDGRAGATIDGHADVDCCAAISPSGRFVARGGDDAILRVWDLDGLPEHDDAEVPAPHGRN